MGFRFRPIRKLVNAHHAQVHQARDTFHDSPVGELPPRPSFIGRTVFLVMGYPDRVVAGYPFIEIVQYER